MGSGAGSGVGSGSETGVTGSVGSVCVGCATGVPLPSSGLLPVPVLVSALVWGSEGFVGLAGGGAGGWMAPEGSSISLPVGCSVMMGSPVLSGRVGSLFTVVP